MPAINGKACVVNGRNLIVQANLQYGYLDRGSGGIVANSSNFHSDNYIATNGATVFTFSSPDYVFKGSGNHTLVMYDSDKNYIGWQSIPSATQTLSKSNVAYIRFSINFTDEGGTSGGLSDWLSTHRYKLEKGSVATPLTPAPVDKVFSNGRQVYGRNLVTNLSYNWTKGWLSDAQIGEPPQFYVNSTRIRTHQTISVSSNYPYTISISDTLFRFSWLELDSNGNITNTAPWITSANYTFTTKSTTTQLYIVVSYKTDAVLDTINLPKIKLEKGSVATPWTPAPEDVM